VPVKVSYTYCDWSDREEIRKKVNKCKSERQEVKLKEKQDVKK
tara:strand:+ start:1571 stop:1699 length:129 start_codon:yes stop_codon:yes gene_type:complete